MTRRVTATLAATLLLAAAGPARADFTMPLSLMPWNAPTVEGTTEGGPATRAATDAAPLPCLDAAKGDACAPGVDRKS